jgi:MFS family permease
VPQKSLWSKDFILIMAINFITALIYYLQMTTLASYSAQTYNASHSLAGFAASIFILGSTFGRLVAGKYLDIIGRRRMCYVGFALYFLASLAYFLPPNIGGLLTVRILHGVLFGASNTAIATVVLDFISPSRRGEGIGYYSLSGTAAAAFGPFIGVLLTQNFPYSAIFTSCALLSLLILVLLPFIMINDHPAPEGPKHSLRISDYYEPNALSIASVMLLICICYSCVTAFINLYATELNILSSVSVFFVIYAVAMFGARPYFGRMLDRKGDNIVMMPMIVSLSLGIGMLALARGPVLLLLSAIPMAIGFGTLMSCSQAIAVKSTTRERAVLANSTTFISSELGLGVGTVLLGGLVDYSGYSGMFGIAAIITLFITVFYWFVHGRYARAKQLATLNEH